MTNPTIYLTNWSSKRHHGPGRKLTIMARPRRWEHGEGRVPALLPSAADLLDVKAGRISQALYFLRFNAMMQFTEGRGLLRPGDLVADVPVGGGEDRVPVSDGDTLLCACAVGAPCHRREAAPFLVRAGWRVRLDGTEVTL